jgi:hypothetical protein
MGLNTKTYRLTDRQSQCELDTKTYRLTDRQWQCDFDLIEQHFSCEACLACLTADTMKHLSGNGTTDIGY